MRAPLVPNNLVSRSMSHKDRRPRMGQEGGCGGEELGADGEVPGEGYDGGERVWGGEAGEEGECCALGEASDNNSIVRDALCMLRLH